MGLIGDQNGQTQNDQRHRLDRHALVHFGHLDHLVRTVYVEHLFSNDVQLNG